MHSYVMNSSSGSEEAKKQTGALFEVDMVLITRRLLSDGVDVG